MRDIEGIEQVVSRLEPYWDEIHAHFEHENTAFKALIAQDHDLIGRVLKCHLVIEHYLGRWLTDHLGIVEISDVRLSFYQKAMLLPDRASAAAFVKPGILCLNKIRNRFGHQLNTALHVNDLGPITEVLNIARQGVGFPEPIDAIEAFTTVASTWLIVAQPNLEKAFTNAFSDVRVNPRRQQGPVG